MSVLIPVPVRIEELDVACSALARTVARHLGLAPEEVARAELVQRALDGRPGRLRYLLTVLIDVAPKVADRLVARRKASAFVPLSFVRWRLKAPCEPKPVVVGTGPAGLFAALTLAQAGVPCVLVEQGAEVERRAHQVAQLYGRGVLDPSSNVCFGEGGAGTFSDGKLYTRVHDPDVAWILDTLVRLGADPDIRVHHRPHLGTDRLVALLLALRAELVHLGAQFLFQRRCVDLVTQDGALRGVVIAGGGGGEVIDTHHAVMATGHSARGVWRMLRDHGAQLEPRPFAVGVRVEHPQELIDRIRYGDKRALLPAADYRLTHQHGGRGVYSFCMCPGGVVVPTPTEPDALCINGMSHAARSGRYANSAIVATMSPAELAQLGFTGLWAGVQFQEALERRAFDLGGGAFVAPAVRVSDFVEGRPSQTLPGTSYRRGLVAADLAALFPADVMDALRQALRAFDARMRGFVTEEAKLIAVETRTASPIRVLRQDGQALGLAGVFPAGEGMGYGGGIVSAAVDGVRAASALLQSLGAERTTEHRPWPTSSTAR